MATNNLGVLTIINSTIYRLITASLIFEYQEIDNIVVQEWKLHGIPPITTIPVPNFGSDQ